MDLVAQLRALGERNRLAVAGHLAGGPLTGIELLRRLPGMSQPSLSRHVGVLRNAGLVVEEKRGREVLYRLVPGPLVQVVLRQAPGESATPADPGNMSKETSDVTGRRDDFQEWLR